MQITSFATPALLFPAISLLMLSYTNKFLAIASLIRNLHDRYEKEQLQVLEQQVANLSQRLYLIRMMQILAIVSFLMCFVCMVFLFLENQPAANWTFGLSLLAMIISLALSLWEIVVSAGALDLLLKDFRDKKNG